MAIKPRELYIILFLLCCLGLASLSFIFNKSSHENYFSQHNSHQRFPAKAQPANRDLKLLKDFFKPNTFGSLIDYQLSTNIFFSNDQKTENVQTSTQFAEQIKVLISKGYINQLEIKHKHQKPIQENVIDLIVKKLMSIAKKSQTTTGVLKAQLYFNPVISKSFSFKKEMSTNHLINYSDKNNLNEFIHNLNVSFEKNIFQTNIPSNGNTYQYIGGIISLSIKEFKTENQKVEVNFRRFFRINRLADLDMVIESRLFDLDVVHFKSHQFQKLPIITVDVIKEYNSKNNTQIIKDMNIYFNKIVGSGFQRITQKELSIPTADLYFKGNTPSSNYKANIHTLSWSFETESFSNQSKMTIELIKPRFDMNYGKIKNDIRNNILKKYAPNIIKHLRLARFHKNLGFEQR